MIGWMLVMLVGCPSSEPEAGGEVLWDHFPFDGVRTWEYISTDESLSYLLIGSMREGDPDPELSCGGTPCNGYHVDFTIRCVAADPDCDDGALVRTLALSSDPNTGVNVLAFESGPTDVVYDPPIALAPKEMGVGETVTTVTDGFEWSSTLVGFEACPVKLQGPEYDALSCAAHLTLEDGDGSVESNYGLAGDYWASIGLGIVAFSLEGDGDAQWQLSDRTCEPEEECDGTW